MTEICDSVEPVGLKCASNLNAQGRDATTNCGGDPQGKTKLNPYHAAAIRKAQALRKYRLPAAQAEGFCGSREVNAFMDATAPHRWAGKNGSMKQLAKRLSDHQIQMLLKHYQNLRDHEVQHLQAINASQVLVDNAARKVEAEKVLEQVQAERVARRQQEQP